MKKLLLFLMAVLISANLFAQSSPTLDLRIPNATTAFGQNIPIGTKVFNVATGQYWVAVAGVEGTSTLTSAAASFAPIITQVYGTAPIRSSGGGRPNITIQPATVDSAGSLSAADKVRVDNVRLIQNHDSLTNLDEKAHASLTDVLGRGSYHISQSERDSIVSAEQHGDTTRNVGHATVFDLTSKVDKVTGQGLVRTTAKDSITTAAQDTTVVHKAGTQTVTGKKTFSNIAALTTSAESWIGPSSTNGIYFKNNFIGIGTTSPSVPLHVSKSISGDWVAKNVNSNTSDGYGLYIQGANNAATFLLGIHNGTDYKLKISGTGVVNIGNLTASKLVFTDASKNLTSTGIGTSSQFVMGDGSLTSMSGTSGIVTKFTASNTIGNSQIYDNGTNVGINQSSPSYKLDIGNGTSESVRVRFNRATTSQESSLYLTTAGVSDWLIGTGAAVGSDFYFYSYGASRSAFTILKTSANIGIATNSPTAKLHIGAGTATAGTAPLKFTTGTLLSTPEAGAIEFLTDAYYGTITTGVARKTFAFLESPTFTGTVSVPLLTFSKAGGSAYSAMITNGSGAIAYSRALGTSAYKDSTYFQTTLTNPILGSGAGTSGKIPKYTANYTIANSIIDDDGDTVTVAGVFRATGNIIVAGPSTSSAFIKTGGTSAQYLLADGSTTTTAGAVYKGTVNGTNGAASWGGTVADGVGTTGWYAACLTAGTYDYGSGNITLAVGDQLYYNGTIWLKVPGAGAYTLPIATADNLGGVKSNSNVSVNGTTGGMTVVTNADLTGEVTSTGNATTIATQNSSTWAGKVTDETGSGALVFATSPTLVTPILGTPQSGNFSTGTFTWPTFNQSTSGTAAGLTAAYIDWNSSSGGSSILNKPDLSVYKAKNDSLANWGFHTNYMAAQHAALTTTAHGLGASAFHADSYFTTANTAITGATKTKITYDSKGLVTSGVDATTSDIAEGTNLYYTDVRVAANSAVTANTAKVTNATHTGDVTGATALTIANKAVTLAKMNDVATGTIFYRKTAGTGAPEVQTLATLATDLGVSSATTFYVESFAEVATGSSGQVNTLAHTPKASTAILVSLNGMELKSTQFTVGTGTVQITIPVYQYDAITISYTY